MSNLFDVVVIGAGPSGMMAAISTKNNTNRVCILEKNPSAGKKLLLTGNGRCNVTTTKDVSDIVSAFGKNGRFLNGSLSRFSNQDLRQFFEKRGVKLKVERGSRVFPVSNKSLTILSCLIKELKRKNVEMLFNFDVRKIYKRDHLFKISSKTRAIFAKKLIIATGGMSYPQTGSTGDGYKFAKLFGHAIIKPEPALIPLITDNKAVRILAGVSLKNVQLSFLVKDIVFSEEFGEMLFTHRGISGPIVLKSSRSVYEQINIGNKVTARIDLKPRLDEIVLKKRIHREIQATPKKEYQSLLAKLLPRLLISYAVKVTKIDKHQQNSTFTKDQINSLIHFLKRFEFEITGVESIKRAIVTHGGVNVKQIDARTMQSKLAPGLFFAGEIICLDGPTGGFNLQKAFSTGFVAGIFASLNT